MKKLLFMLMGVAATINVMAVDYSAKANLLLQATSDEDCEMYLRQSDSYGTLEGYDMFMDNRQVALYALNGEQKLQMAKAADLTNVYLGLKTDASTTYTITVSGVAGDETLVLWDLVAGEQYNLTEGKVINITATANSTIEDRFVINYVAPATSYNVTLNDEYLATFSAAENVVIPAGLKAYQAEYVSMSEVLALSPIASYIPANTGVILYNEAKDNKNFALDIYTGTDAMPTIDANDLKPATEWENRTGTIYILHGSELWEYTGADFVDNKAYLELPVSVPAPKRIRLVFNQATDIDNVEAGVKAEKFIENGQIFIRRGNEVFNLQGQNVK